MTTQYAGTELDVFSHAANWKAYLRMLTAPYLRGRVLEVGAGIGSTTRAFRSGSQESWTAIEPDERLVSELRSRVTTLSLPVEVAMGTISSLPEERRFECVLYVDVLEHIEDDAGELKLACSRLATGGTIVALSPAHQWLYSPFDAAIGHHRRYSRRQLRAITPAGLQLIHMQYLDAVGLILSTGNRVVLRSEAPSLSQVLFWDRWCIPVSRQLDRLTTGRLGKSILAIWRKA
ncbi:MAG: class I SAM-dependent methyltransferase [Acidobacteria bacterium]|nr:class I SAM-dependent methyltransferase [Acidobacteriota bacterium]